MRGYFGLGQLSPSEKSDILDQHKHVYNGYKSMLPQVSNTQPLYVQDYANDKNGITVNNKGEVKHYTNFGINEQVSKESMCECGGMMYEGVCNECGSSYMEEGTNEGSGESEMCECGGMMHEGVCNECGSGYMEEETGHLDDIYNVEDFDPKAGFDYIEGSSNDVDTFEKKHKKLSKNGEMEEQGGNAADMDVDDVDSAFDFESEGPGMGDSYPVTEEGNMDDPEITYDTMESAWMDEELDEVDISGSQGIYADMEPAYDFDSGGAGPAGPYQRRNEHEFRPNVDLGKSFEKLKDKKSDKHGIESFFKNKLKSSTDEEFSPNEHESGYEGEDEDAYWEKDLAPDELDLDLDKFNPKDKSWEEIKSHTGDWDEIDEDLQESFIHQKNKIMEMMNRMKVIK